MTKDEALRLALDALESTGENNGYHGVTQYFDETMVDQAITAIKAALEAKDEPIATKNNDGVTLHLGWDDLPVGTKLYATPPQRTWVGLTDMEIDQGLCRTNYAMQTSGAWRDGVEWAEAKLKEKNT